MKISVSDAVRPSDQNYPGPASVMAVVALTLIGLFYYSSYYNYYFNWADEGSVALITERLAQGERPYVEVDPSYGILWYYPIVVLHKIFGVNFLTVRVWFIFIGFAAALVSYALLLRLTRKPAIAFLIALLVLVFPGSG